MVATGPPIRPLRDNRNAAVTASAATAAFRFNASTSPGAPSWTAAPAPSRAASCGSTARPATRRASRDPSSISEPGTSPSCVTVGFTTQVTRDSPLSPDGGRHVTANRCGGSFPTST